MSGGDDACRFRQGEGQVSTLNRKTRNRVESRYVDAETGKEVQDEVKGYQTGEDEYVMLEDEELEAAGLESTRTIDIETFVDAYRGRVPFRIAFEGANAEPCNS